MCEVPTPSLVGQSTADELADSWGLWIAGLRDWDYFGGCTYDQNRRPRDRFWGGLVLPRGVTRDGAIAHFRKWISRCEQRLGRKVHYVAALEYQKNGWPHFHPLLDVAGGRRGDIALIGSLWFREWGYVKLERPRGSLAVARYAAKYLSKDISAGDVLLSAGLAGGKWNERGAQVRLVRRDGGKSFWAVQ